MQWWLTKKNSGINKNENKIPLQIVIQISKNLFVISRQKIKLLKTSTSMSRLTLEQSTATYPIDKSSSLLGCQSYDQKYWQMFACRLRIVVYVHSLRFAEACKRKKNTKECYISHFAGEKNARERRKKNARIHKFAKRTNWLNLQ